MSTLVNVAGAWKTAVPWMNVAGAWKKVMLWTNVGGVWKKVDTQNSNVNVTPNSVQGYGRSKGTIPITTGQATVNNYPSGSTFSWVLSNSEQFTVVSPNSASTSFRASAAPSEEKTTSAYCVVTANGISINTNTIDAIISNTY